MTMRTWTIEPTTCFGPHFTFDVGDANVIIVATVSPMRLHELLLPHQLSVEQVKRIMRANPTKSLLIIPARSSEYIHISDAALVQGIADYEANVALSKMPWGVRVGEAA